MLEAALELEEKVGVRALCRPPFAHKTREGWGTRREKGGTPGFFGIRRGMRGSMTPALEKLGYPPEQIKVNPKVKSGIQECPPHTGFNGCTLGNGEGSWI